MGAAWDDLRTVLMLVRHRTLAGAAKAMGVNYTTVARRYSTHGRGDECVTV